MICDPISDPRIILTAGMYGMQVVQLPKETLWLFDWFYTRREIWTDGRKLPDDPEPRFYGYSIGHWEDLREDVCVPSQEARYKDLVRVPAGNPNANQK